MACGNQRTVGSPASLAGTSLHTGQPVTLTLKPAPADFGIKFRRVDIPDQPFINADVEKVQTVERATSLAEGSVKVHTVEHILSALTGMGIDNAVIEMDANEPPIGDGSSAPYVELIKSAGIVELEVPRRYLEVREAVTIETKGGSILTILPSKEFRVSVTCVGPENRITQYFDAVITPETYEKELAPARTFTFYEDIKPLLEKGLIKGGSLENAVVIRGEELMSKEPMRFINEFARHKAMDLIGDLSLCGKPILGHVIAIKPGHGPNTELTAKLKKEHRRNQQMAPNPVNVPYGDAVLDINEVMNLLPHRYPFLMVDRIIGFEGETKCRGLKNLTMNELFFQGHFPGHPVMPGVLQLEAMAQVASIVMLTSFTHKPYYQAFEVEIPDNWEHAKMYNLPLDEMMEATDYALKNGYTVCWDGDVSEKGFSFKHGVAINPETGKTEDLKDTDFARWQGMDAQERLNEAFKFEYPCPEVKVTPEIRQKGYESFVTTDDHLMHLTGIAKDQNGTKYYITKNSWGTDRNDFGGYLNMSESYVRAKTIYVLVYKDALSKDMKKKLGLAD